MMAVNPQTTPVTHTTPLDQALELQPCPGEGLQHLAMHQRRQKPAVQSLLQLCSPCCCPLQGS